MGRTVPSPGIEAESPVPGDSASFVTSAFYYPTTRSKLRLIREVEPEIRFAEFGNADTEIPLPFVRFDEYASMLGNFRSNVVRGENSAIKAMLTGKPFLWDFYKESNGAHEEKIGDFLDFVRPFFVDEKSFAAYVDATRAINSDEFDVESARKCADILRGDCEPFVKMAETVRKDDLTMTVVTELET